MLISVGRHSPLNKLNIIMTNANSYWGAVICKNTVQPSHYPKIITIILNRCTYISPNFASYLFPRVSILFLFLSSLVCLRSPGARLFPQRRSVVLVMAAASATHCYPGYNLHEIKPRTRYFPSRIEWNEHLLAGPATQAQPLLC